jgi:hypothetical protein
MRTPVRIEIPAAESVEGSVPEKLKLDRKQAHGVAVQLEEQGFGYGAFWCKPPTIREALWILWSAIRGKEFRTYKTPSMSPWDYVDDDPYDPWTGEPPADQEQPPPPPPPPPSRVPSR